MTGASARSGTHDGTEPVIEATGLAKRYGSRLPFTRTVEVLDGADIAISPGTLIGIVGENGSGKSTLMKILVGVLDPDAGTVTRRGSIGWCPQEPLLYDRLTMRETVRLFGEASGLNAETRDERLSWLADRLRFERFLDTRVDRLSGGNRQKLNLSLALLADPDVLLLDEPYAGFDYDTYLAFWELAEELVEEGTTIVVISHFVRDRQRFDDVYELVDGGLVREEG